MGFSIKKQRYLIFIAVILRDLGQRLPNDVQRSEISLALRCHCAAVKFLLKPRSLI
jgi:hypothetical protein